MRAHLGRASHRADGRVRPAGCPRATAETARRRAARLLTILLVVTPVATVPTAHSAGRARRIVVEITPRYWNPDFSAGLFKVDVASGERVKRLTSGAGRQPMWSPNRRKIVYATGYEDNLEIWVVRRDGSHERRITHNRKLDESPSWSPDSRRLVVERYDASDGGYDSELFIVKADGSGERNLTKNRVDDECPDWSPKGSRIAFQRRRGYNLYTIRPDGTSERQLTRGRAVDRGPKWSPDGRRILFTRISANGKRQNLFVIRRDGTHLRRLTDTAPNVSLLVYAWSPDGKKVAFVNSRDGFHFSLFVIRVGGSHRVRLGSVGDHYYAVSPTWSRDSRKVAYTRRISTESADIVDVWIARADGSRRRNVTRTENFDEYGPDWSSSPQECAGAY